MTFVLLAIAGCGRNAVAPQSVSPPNTTPGWDVDEAMKFHLAHLPTSSPPTGNVETPAPLGFGQPFAPDISNIRLDAILALGFPLPRPEQPEGHKLYLKFFAFPRVYDARRSAGQITKNFLLDRIPGGARIDAFLENDGSVVVKEAWIGKADEVYTSAHPSPRLTVERSALGQANFDRELPFSSLYVKPSTDGEAATDDERAKASAAGVIAVHRDLLALYRRTLAEVSGPESSKFYYFDGEGAQFRLLREPLVFAGWRDLPMPHNPKHMFLSGLLLVLRRDAAGRSAHMLEVGAVVRQP